MNFSSQRTCQRHVVYARAPQELTEEEPGSQRRGGQVGRWVGGGNRCSHFGKLTVRVLGICILGDGVEVIGAVLQITGSLQRGGKSAGPHLSQTLSTRISFNSRH